MPVATKRADLPGLTSKVPGCSTSSLPTIFASVASLDVLVCIYRVSILSKTYLIDCLLIFINLFLSFLWRVVHLVCPKCENETNAPVCGNNFVTYPNLCSLERENCQNLHHTPIQVLHNGNGKPSMIHLKMFLKSNTFLLGFNIVN